MCTENIKPYQSSSFGQNTAAPSFNHALYILTSFKPRYCALHITENGTVFFNIVPHPYKYELY